MTSKLYITTSNHRRCLLAYIWLQIAKWMLCQLQPHRCLVQLRKKHLRHWRKPTRCHQQHSIQKALRKSRWLSQRQFLRNQLAMLLGIMPNMMRDMQSWSSSTDFISLVLWRTWGHCVKENIRGTTPWTQYALPRTRNSAFYGNLLISYRGGNSRQGLLHARNIRCTTTHWLMVLPIYVIVFQKERTDVSNGRQRRKAAKAR